MSDAAIGYTLPELADLAGVSVRTVRYYQLQGLLAAPGVRGGRGRYGDTDLARLRLIRRLQREHLPLAEIRTRLASLSDVEIEMLLGAADSEPTPAAPADSALDYIRAVLGTSHPVPEVDLARSPASLAAARRAATLPAAAASAPSTDSIPVAPNELAERVPEMNRLAYRRAAEAHAASPPDQPHQIERSQWERIVLATDVELHVRRPLPRSVAKQVDRLITIAADLLKEDPS
jgi:DNA-binding transcriptional MerR regulator